MQGSHRFAKAIALVVLGFLSTTAFTQSLLVDAHYANTIGGSAADHANGVAMDADGNAIVVGHYFGTLTLGDDEYTSNGNQDAFVAKYDTQGELIWGVAFGGGGADEARAVAVDAQGNCYVAGFVGSFNVDILDQTITSLGGYDVMLLKFSSSGELLWTRTYGSASNDMARAVAVDADGAIGIAGAFQGTMVVGQTTLVSTSSLDGFVARFDSTGNAEWAAQISGPNQVEGRGIAMNADGHTYVSGDFLGGSVTSGGFTETGGGSFDAFIAGFDALGAPTVLRAFGGTGADSILSLTTHTNGDLIATGYMEGEVDFDDLTLTGNGNRDILLLKLDGNHDTVWARNIGITGNDIGYGVATDGSGNSYLTGLFAGQITVGDFELSGGGNLLAAFDSDGGDLWALNFGDANADSGGRGLSATSNGSLAVVGSYLSPFTIGGIEVDMPNSRDAFLVKLNSVTVVGIDEPSSETKLRVYPNPSNGIFWVDGWTQRATIAVYDPTGRRIGEWATAAPSFRFDLSEHPNGVYTVTVVADGVFRRQAVLLVK